jgi:NAD(P)-dependent dehydrogenase (short-subunit alcohol dehydrogenase family)
VSAREVTMEGGYSGKEVLITGGASGIGRALALAFASKGASLLLVDVDRSGLESAAQAVESRGAEARCYITDVSISDEVARLHKEVSAEAGVPDILVNCAGVAETAAIEEAPLEDWAHVLGVNLWGSINTLHYFLPDMYIRGSGHVVNVASVAGLFSSAFQGLYVTSKFALVGLTETLRAEAAVHGVNVSTICPGFIDTPMLDDVKTVGFAESDTSRLKRFAPSPEKLAAKILRGIEKNKPLVIYPVSYKGIFWLKKLSQRLFDKTNRKLASVSYKVGHINGESSERPKG